jgi:hypothetical protein
MQLKYLIAIDSDGTLRHDDGTISDRTKIIVSKLVDLGNYVVICTARPRYHTKKIVDESLASQILVSSNGTEIYDNDKKTLVFVAYVEKNCIELYNYAKENDIRIIFVVDETEYVTHFIRNDKQKLLSNEIDINKFFEENKVKQCMILDNDKEKIEGFKKHTIEIGLKINNFSNPYEEEQWFSVVTENSSKGEALVELAKYLNIPIENTIAIGNDYNDIPMFEIAGISVAVDNSNNSIKAHVDIVIKSNEDDGVAEYLETII